jgi:hypothetical protein
MREYAPSQYALELRLLVDAPVRLIPVEIRICPCQEPTSRIARPNFCTKVTVLPPTQLPAILGEDAFSNKKTMECVFNTTSPNLSEEVGHAKAKRPIRWFVVLISQARER